MLIDKGLCVVHCSMLAEDAIKSAISNYYTKNPNAKATSLAGTGASIADVAKESGVKGAAAAAATA